MSVTLPFRRAGPRCLSTRATAIALNLRQPQRRAASSDDRASDAKKATIDVKTESSDAKKDEEPAQANPVLEEYLKKAAQNPELPQEPMKPKSGDIASSSIFADEEASRGVSEQETPDASPEPKTAAEQSFPGRDIANMAKVLDPLPAARLRWERKKVIQSIRKGGRVNRETIIKRTEREHLAKSENIKTSTKKLGMLARQIAGKSLEEAIVQMRFSKKKAAKSVQGHLEAARDEAIVMRGMGLGGVKTDGEESAADPKSVDIQLKDGKRHTVTDPSKIYIDQAWVGKGPYGKLPEYRARGRINLIRTPWTSVSVLLKEEKTRVREYKDREEKRQKKRIEKLWTQLPDRPIQGPRGQYYSW